jgi:hypothetical protein
MKFRRLKYFAHIRPIPFPVRHHRRATAAAAATTTTTPTKEAKTKCAGGLVFLPFVVVVVVVVANVFAIGSAAAPERAAMSESWPLELPALEMDKLRPCCGCGVLGVGVSVGLVMKISERRAGRLVFGTWAEQSKVHLRERCGSKSNMIV